MQQVSECVCGPLTSKHCKVCVLTMFAECFHAEVSQLELPAAQTQTECGCNRSSWATII